eukprot:404985-Pleurochrysis_carterae.AAC.1
MACPNRTVHGDQFSYNVPPGPPWIRQLHHINYSHSTRQPLEGRARFGSVARTNSFNHARLSWRALPT